MYKSVPCLLLMLAVCALGIPQENPKPEKTLPAVNEVDSWQQVGQQPYEFTLTQREQDPHTLVDFEDVQGGTLELYNGAQGELRRSREQQLWGEYVAKIVYSGVREQSRVIARPPQPISIPGAFDSVDLWGYGNRWSWGRSTCGYAGPCAGFRRQRGRPLARGLREWNRGLRESHRGGDVGGHG